MEKKSVAAGRYDHRRQSTAMKICDYWRTGRDDICCFLHQGFMWKWGNEEVVGSAPVPKNLRDWVVHASG
jgi:hypothetical protein